MAFYFFFKLHGSRWVDGGKIGCNFGPGLAKWMGTLCIVVH
jgi:hypothetical protein